MEQKRIKKEKTLKNFHRTDIHNNDYIQRLQKMIRHMITHTQNFHRNDNKNVRQSLVAEYTIPAEIHSADNSVE